MVIVDTTHLLISIPLRSQESSRNFRAVLAATSRISSRSTNSPSPRLPAMRERVRELRVKVNPPRQSQVAAQEESESAVRGVHSDLDYHQRRMGCATPECGCRSRRNTTCEGPRSRTYCGRASARGWSADRWWKRERRGPPRNIFGCYRNGPKTLGDFAFFRCPLTAISACHLTLAEDDPFWPERNHSITQRQVVSAAPMSRDSSKASTPVGFASTLPRVAATR
jgi:hypothetical protein